MKKNLYLSVWIALILFTIVSAVISNIFTESIAIAIILILSVIKFIGVAFYFMGLNKANVFWKTSVVLFVSIFAAFVLIAS